MKIHIHLLLLGCTWLAACSSLQSGSQADDKGARTEGLTYYMPKRDFLVQITQKAGQVTDVKVDVTPAYPDLGKGYALTYSTNLLGKNTLDIQISSAGLLQSGKATTESKVAEVVKGLAASAGAIAPHAMMSKKTQTKPSTECITDGVSTFLISIPTPTSTDKKYCGLDVTVTAIGAPDKSAPSGVSTSTSPGSGIYYRQDRPYLVTIKGQGWNYAAVAMSPNESSIGFLPIARTFFANNDAGLEFKDGVPTKYKQEADGEAIALVKLPADVIGAYISAVGNIFSAFKTRDGSEAEAIKGQVALELAKRKQELCIAAIKDNDDQKIKELACGS